MSALAIIYRFALPYKRTFLWAVVVTTLCTTASMAPPMIVREVVDKVIGQRRQELLVPLLAVFVVVPLLAAGGKFLNGYLISTMGAKLVLDVRRKVYGHMLSLPMSFFDKTSTGMVMERLMGDVGQIQKLVTRQTVTIATDLMSCVVAICAMFYLNSRLALIPMLFVPVYVVTHRYFRARVRRATEEYRSKLDDIGGTVGERLRSTAIVKAFGQEANESRRMHDVAYAAQVHGTQAYKYSVAFNTAATLQTWLARIGIVLLGYYMIIHSQMTLGSVVAFTAYSAYLLGPAVRFAHLSNMLAEVMVSVHRIGVLLDEAPETPDAPDALAVGRLAGKVEFKNLSFQYESDQMVLEDINLSVPAGSTVAFVGHTGCGKTTLVSLLYRFYDLTEGQILIDSMDITDIRRHDLRNNLSLVPQDPVVFEGTVSQNIAYGRPGASPADIEVAAGIAELSEVIAELPDGFDTQLGGAEAKLSVGQKQRLMIARAVLTDPSILILDEATSSLDTESERALQDALDKVMRGRTSFVIAHRLSTIVNADMIVAMDGGRIVEVGTHTELMAHADGHYRQLYLRQFTKVA